MRLRSLQYNKKGDIPTTILVLGVFIVCTLTLLNFYFVGLRDDNSFGSVVLVKEISKIIDEIKFYDILGKNSLELAGNSKIIIDEDFKIEKSERDGGYSLKGIINEKKYGFIEGDQIVKVEYDFPS